MGGLEVAWIQVWVAGWSTGLWGFGSMGGNSVVGTEVWEAVSEWVAGTEVWEAVSEWVAGKPGAKVVSRRYYPTGGEGHHPRAAAQVRTSHPDIQSGRTASKTQEMAELINSRWWDAQGKIVKGTANLQLLGAAIGGTLTHVSGVVRLQACMARSDGPPRMGTGALGVCMDQVRYTQT